MRLNLKKICTYPVLLCLLCFVLAACQQTAPYEVVLLPSKTPEVTAVPSKVPLTEVPVASSTAVEPVEETEEIEPSEAVTQVPTPTASEEPTPTPSPTPTPTPAAADDMHYYVQQENKAVKTLFWHLYNEILQHKANIELPEGTTRENVDRAAWLLSVDCPELFWFSHISGYSFMENEPDVILSVTAEYRMDAEKTQKAQKEIDALIEKWSAAVKDASDYKKELYVHDALLKDCRYSASGSDSGTAYGAMILGKARCQGYANALCLCLRRMGIECAVITGTATNAQGTENHAWNLMKIDGTWTLTDATWNDPVGKDTVMYAYFNITDDLMGQSHTKDKVYVRYDLPGCTSMKRNYCVSNDRHVAAGADVKQAVIDWAAAYLTDADAPRMIGFAESSQYEEAVALLSECLQAAVDQTGKTPKNGSFRYLLEPGANYLQFE